ncbi:MAG: hypothetical protein D6761_12205, partial [Candidatus Dadabacteria bacterium]
DVNGDGRDDLLVGEPFYSQGILTFRGRVWVYYGTAAGTYGNPVPLLAPTVDPSFDYFGVALADLGDVNGDGYGDVAIGTFDGDKVFVYYGGPGGLTNSNKTEIRNSQGDTIVPLPAAGAPTWFGRAVAGGADLNDDGFDDLVVGAPIAQRDFRGAVVVFWGGSDGISRDRRQVLLLQGVLDRLDQFGTSVAVGDFDGDGRGDLAAGAPGSSGGTGRAFVFFGTPTGLDPIPRVLNGSGGLFGRTVANLGDTNTTVGDELGIGAPDFSGRGRVTIYGRPGPGSPPPVQIRMLGTGNTVYGKKGEQVCVPNVVQTFDDLIRNRTNRQLSADYDVPGLDKNRDWGSSQGHIQGLGRLLPGEYDSAMNDTWLVLSRNDNREVRKAGLIFTEFFPRPGVAAESLSGAFWADNVQKHGDARWFESMENSTWQETTVQFGRHPGGLHNYGGGEVAVAVKCDGGSLCAGTGYVLIYVFRGGQGGGLAMNVVQAIALHDPAFDYPAASAANRIRVNHTALIRLLSGQYLLMTFGAGDDEGWFYLSDNNNPIQPTTRWTLVQHWDKGDPNHLQGRWPDGNAAFQNGNLIQECGTKAIYYIGMGNNQVTEDRLRLYRVDLVPDSASDDVDNPLLPGDIRLTEISSHSLDLNRNCNFRGGSGIYVAANGVMGWYCDEKVPNLANGHPLEYRRK